MIFPVGARAIVGSCLNNNMRVLDGAGVEGGRDCIVTPCSDQRLTGGSVRHNMYIKIDKSVDKSKGTNVDTDAASGDDDRYLIAEHSYSNCSNKLAVQQLANVLHAPLGCTNFDANTRSCIEQTKQLGRTSTFRSTTNDGYNNHRKTATCGVTRNFSVKPQPCDDRLPPVNGNSTNCRIVFDNSASRRVRQCAERADLISESNSNRLAEVKCTLAEGNMDDSVMKKMREVTAQLMNSNLKATSAFDFLSTKKSVHAKPQMDNDALFEDKSFSNKSNAENGSEKAEKRKQRTGERELFQELNSVLKRLQQTSTNDERFVELEKGRAGKSVLYVGRTGGKSILYPAAVNGNHRLLIRSVRDDHYECNDSDDDNRVSNNGCREMTRSNSANDCTLSTNEANYRLPNETKPLTISLVNYKDKPKTEMKTSVTSDLLYEENGHNIDRNHFSEMELYCVSNSKKNCEATNNNLPNLSTKLEVNSKTEINLDETKLNARNDAKPDKIEANSRAQMKPDRTAIISRDETKPKQIIDANEQNEYAVIVKNIASLFNNSNISSLNSTLKTYDQNNGKVSNDPTHDQNNGKVSNNPSYDLDLSNGKHPSLDNNLTLSNQNNLLDKHKEFEEYNTSDENFLNAYKLSDVKAMYNEITNNSNSSILDVDNKRRSPLNKTFRGDILKIDNVQNDSFSQAKGNEDLVLNMREMRKNHLPLKRTSTPANKSLKNNINDKLMDYHPTKNTSSLLAFSVKEFKEIDDWSEIEPFIETNRFVANAQQPDEINKSEEKETSNYQSIISVSATNHSQTTVAVDGGLVNASISRTLNGVGNMHHQLSPRVLDGEKLADKIRERTVNNASPPTTDKEELADNCKTTTNNLASQMLDKFADSKSPIADSNVQLLPISNEKQIQSTNKCKINSETFESSLLNSLSRLSAPSFCNLDMNGSNPSLHQTNSNTALSLASLHQTASDLHSQQQSNGSFQKLPNSNISLYRQSQQAANNDRRPLLQQSSNDTDDDFTEIEYLLNAIASNNDQNTPQAAKENHSDSRKYKLSTNDGTSVSLKTLKSSSRGSLAKALKHKQGVHSEPKRLSSKAYLLANNFAALPCDSKVAGAKLSATFPLKRAHGKMITGNANDEQLMDNLFITHSGNYVLPDMSNKGNGMSRRGKPTNANVTVPRPTSFHQFSNSVGGRLLAPYGSISRLNMGHLSEYSALDSDGKAGDAEKQNGHFCYRTLEYQVPTSYTISDRMQQHDVDITPDMKATHRRSTFRGTKQKLAQRRSHSSDRKKQATNGDSLSNSSPTSGASPHPHQRKRRTNESAKTVKEKKDGRSVLVSSPSGNMCMPKCCGSQAARKSKQQQQANGKEESESVQSVDSFYRDIYQYHQSLLDYVSSGSNIHIIRNDSNASEFLDSKSQLTNGRVPHVACCFGCGQRHASNASSYTSSSQECNNNKGCVL